MPLLKKFQPKLNKSNYQSVLDQSALNASSTIILGKSMDQKDNKNNLSVNSNIFNNKTLINSKSSNSIIKKSAKQSLKQPLKVRFQDNKSRPKSNIKNTNLQQTKKPVVNSAEQQYQKIYQATNLYFKIQNTNVIEIILDFLPPQSLFKMRLLQKSTNSFLKLYFQKKLASINQHLQKFPNERVKIIDELIKNLKERSKKIQDFGNNDLIEILQFKYPCSIIQKIFQVIFFIKEQKEAEDFNWIDMTNDYQAFQLLEYFVNDIDVDLNKINQKQKDQLQNYLANPRLSSSNVQIVSNTLGSLFIKIRIILHLHNCIYQLGENIVPLIKQQAVLNSILNQNQVLNNLNNSINKDSINASFKY